MSKPARTIAHGRTPSGLTPRTSAKEASNASAIASATRTTPTSPGSPAHSTYLIGQLDRIVTKRLAEALAGYGLTLPQFTALSVLHARGRSSNAQLAERSFITPQAANEVMKTMEANGWVTRTNDPTNRRIVLLQLTTAGQVLLEQCMGAADRVETAMLHGLDTDQAQLLRSMLQICIRNLRSA